MATCDIMLPPLLKEMGAGRNGTEKNTPLLALAWKPLASRERCRVARF